MDTVEHPPGVMYIVGQGHCTVVADRMGTVEHPPGVMYIVGQGHCTVMADDGHCGTSIWGDVLCGSRTLYSDG